MNIQSFLYLLIMPFILLMAPIGLRIKYLLGYDCVFQVSGHRSGYIHHRSDVYYHSDLITRYYYQHKKLYCIEYAHKAQNFNRKVWVRNDVWHRADGPAMEEVDDHGEYREWYLYGVKVSAQDVFDKLTDEQKEKAIWELDKWK